MGNRYQDRHQYFDELVETSTAFYVDYIRRFIPIAEGTRILEVGCGEGGNLLPFALIGCDVTGVDFSAKKIENARNYFWLNGSEGAFFWADFFDFPLQDKPFDVVLVHDVMEHIVPEDKGRFLERIRAFLAPGGVAFLALNALWRPSADLFPEGAPFPAVDTSDAETPVSGNTALVQGARAAYRGTDGHPPFSNDRRKV